VSDYRAIATVTEALRSKLEAEARLEPDFAGADGTAESPEKITNPPAKPTINVFLYQVSPNVALRNADTPTRDSGGAMLTRPRAALDLHYLITTYGAAFEPQHLLGIVVRALHSTPFLTKKEIDDASAIVKGVFGSEVDSVKFIPAPISLDELSKLWSVFFQTKYALSATYQASVVVIDARQTAAPALPVRTRNLRVLPSLGPVIDHLASSTLLPGDTLQIHGHDLRGDATRVRIFDALTDKILVESDVIKVELKAPLVLRAGVSTVRVVHSVDFGVPSGLHHVFESNVMPFVLSPKVSGPTHTRLPKEKVTVTVDPKVFKDQRLTLMLTEVVGGNDRTYTFTATAAADGVVQEILVSAPIAAGKYLVRLQVDGATSPLEVAADGKYSGPLLTVV